MRFSAAQKKIEEPTKEFKILFIVNLALVVIVPIAGLAVGYVRGVNRLEGLLQSFLFLSGTFTIGCLVFFVLSVWGLVKYKRHKPTFTIMLIVSTIMIALGILTLANASLVF